MASEGAIWKSNIFLQIYFQILYAILLFFLQRKVVITLINWCHENTFGISAGQRWTR